jgi:hypothetical protein
MVREEPTLGLPPTEIVIGGSGCREPATAGDKNSTGEYRDVEAAAHGDAACIASGASRFLSAGQEWRRIGG